MNSRALIAFLLLGIPTLAVADGTEREGRDLPTYPTETTGLTHLASTRVATPAVSLAEGGQLAKIQVPVPADVGVSVAFDGTYLYYTNYGNFGGIGTDAHLYKINKSGTLVATLNTGVSSGIGALAYDAGRKKLWGASQDGSGRIYLIDPATGTATYKFTAAGGYPIDDGLAYDGLDDTIWYSNDVSTTIFHYSVTGTLIGTLIVPFGNSGLAVGGSIIYAGSDGEGRIYKLDKQTGAILGVFASPGGRDEDLECDGVSFAPKLAMWSRDAYDGSITAFELQCCNTCQLGGGLDSDGDGLLDQWEENGFDYDNDGTVDVDLPAMGADKNVRDVFVEVDYMTAANHTHQLLAAALQTVVDAFSARGIHLHVDNGSTSEMDPVTHATWGALSRSESLTETANLGTTDGAGNYDWAAFQALKVAHFSSSRLPIFHYVISAHNLATAMGSTSGISRNRNDFSLGAADLIVSLGGWTNQTGTVGEQAGTFMHELGHNLGLRHGGIDHTNFKPNYLSVMSYAYQTRGLIVGGTEGHYDYSGFTLPSLDENNLDENVGLNGGAGINSYGAKWYCGATLRTTNAANSSIDWNCTAPATQTGVSTDINKDGVRNVLATQDDWANLVFTGGAVGDHGGTFDEDVPSTPWVTEITQQEDALITVNRPPDCSNAVACSPTLWPPNHQYLPVTICGVTDPDGDAVQIAVTGVTQDEPVNSRADGNACPDARIVNGQAALSSERNAGGNGRVYAVAFTATDAQGASCSGTVYVCVPHDDNSVCVNDGQLYDSTTPCRAVVPEAVDLRVVAVGDHGATLAFDLGANQHVELAAFDVAGRRIATIVDETLAPGSYERTWDVSHVANGLYFVRMSVGGVQLTRVFVKTR